MPVAGQDRYAVAHRAEQVQLPDWMRQVGTEQLLDRSERRRLVWGRHRGKLLVGGVALGMLALLGATAVVVGTVADAVRTATPSLPSPTSSGERRAPFAGTPAAGFAVGEKGIHLPPARVTGPFSAAQVRSALDTTRRALIESRLAPTMLGGDPDPFLAVLADAARESLSPYFTETRFRHFATRVDAPGRRCEKGRLLYRRR